MNRWISKDQCTKTIVHAPYPRGVTHFEKWRAAKVTFAAMKRRVLLEEQAIVRLKWRGPQKDLRAHGCNVYSLPNADDELRVVCQNSGANAQKLTLE